jgi:hypothetical protein
MSSSKNAHSPLDIGLRSKITSPVEMILNDRPHPLEAHFVQTA